MNESSIEAQGIEEGAAFAAAISRRETGLTSAFREPVDVLVIGGGQAGLSVGYHLKQRGVRFLIVDGAERVGDVWRKRWDSLRLFTPAWLDGLDGLPFPAHRDHFPTKDEMADYLEAYAVHFALPVVNGCWVSELTRDAEGFRVVTNQGVFRAKQVVIAMSSYQQRRVPDWASGLSKDVVQLHGSEYKNPEQLRPGAVLMVGAGNSGAEIGIELAQRGHPVFLSGRNTGFVPFRMGGFWARLILARIVLRGLFHHLLTVRTALGRKARAKMITQGGPLIRQRPQELAAAGIERVARTAGSESGLPRLEDGRVLEVANVIFSSGFASGLEFVKLPIFDDTGEPQHDAGVVTSHPGLYFVGQHFQYSFSSTMIHGVGRDAARIAAHVAERARDTAGPETVPGVPRALRAA